MPEPRTLTEAFQQTLQVDPDAVAIRTPGDEVAITWREYGERVRRVAEGLHALGVRRGDTVGIMLTNRPEFAVVDAGAMHLGAVAFSIYNTSSPEQVEYLFDNAENRVVVTETAFVDVVRKADPASVEHLVVVDGDGSDGTLTLDRLESTSSEGFDFDAAWRAVEPDDVLTLIYTSGTTGPPKGVQLTHANMLAVSDSAAQVVDVSFGDRITSFLPSAHIADRASAQYFQACRGVQVTHVADPRQIATALPDARPTIWFAVPRVWEKIKLGIEAKVAAEEDPRKKRLAEWALAQGAAKARAELSGRSAGLATRVQYAVADRLVLSKVRAAIGLDQLKWAWSGAAAIAPETLEFFLGLGIDVCEIWGMSEISGAGTINPPGRAKVGTVGPAMPGFEMRLADDGELLVRSASVMKGYRKEPEKTAEAIDADGWLHTGDVATIDEDGYVAIVDRKKEIIINAAGKNMSPANIENTLKVSTPLAAAITVVGDGRPYNVALVSLDPDAASAWAEQAGLPPDPEQLSREPRLVAAVQEGIDAGNARLSRVEQVKRFEIVPSWWLPGGDELTPTLKLKRKPIGEKYAATIDRLYSRDTP